MINATLVSNRLVLRQGDCLDALKQWPDNSVDAIVTDPPYGLNASEPDILKVLRHWLAGERYEHRAAGFMGKKWDAFVPDPDVWRQCLRILKPGGHIVASGSARTYDLLTIGLRIAGFEIRTTVAWAYGNGLSASHGLGQSVEKLITTGRTARAPRDFGGESRKRFNGTGKGSWIADSGDQIALTTPEAQQWSGWGTRMRPAFEPIVIARKPLELSTVPANVLKHGTGALNMTGCAVIAPGEKDRQPATLVHDGSDDIIELFPTGAARFFYVAKPRDEERAVSDHPTMKPVALMRWLCRLVTPPNGIVVDPYAGSGTTGEAIVLEGFRGMLIEREEKYCRHIVQRFAKPITEAESKPVVESKPKLDPPRRPLHDMRKPPRQGDLF